MAFLLRFLPWPVLATVGAVGIGAAVATGAWGLVEFGIGLRKVQVDNQIQAKQRQDDRANLGVDKETFRRDAALEARLKEIEAKWRIGTSVKPSPSQP